MPPSPVARQGQHPAVLALLPASSESHAGRLTASFRPLATPKPWQGSDESAHSLGIVSGSSALLPLEGAGPVSSQSPWL